jgi:pectin methylesterase-like acyl-CoA thioesterase
MKSNRLGILIGVSMSLTFLAGNALARDLYVCNEMADDAGCTHTSIQSAVEWASDGDVIHVPSGVFPGQISIYDRSITLEGVGQSVSRIQVDGNDPAILCYNSSGDPASVKLTVQNLGMTFITRNTNIPARVKSEGCTVNGKAG